ncbi:restriction endonuclease subunit S [Vibrio vulnificus]|nr:restriction endonuclease subunit S [Vibrio vulnificus]
MSWEKRKLSDVATLIRGVTFAKAEGVDRPDNGRVPVIRAGSIQKTLLVNDGQIWVPQEKVKPHQLIKENDILMCTSSGSSDLVGKCAKSDADYDVSFGAFCAGIRPDLAKVSPSYLYHFLCSPTFKNWTRNSSGANIKNIRASELAEFEIPLPPLDEQKRIAAILDKADAIRQKRKQAIVLADEFLRSVFLEMFGDPVTNPKGWEVKSLGSMILKGPTNGLYKPSSSYGSGCRILRIDGFYDGELVGEEKLKRVELSEDELVKYLLPARSVVINRVNSPEYLGKCAFVENLSESTVFESNMMNFIVDENLINPRFLVMQLQMPNIKKQIQTRAKHAVNQSSINQQDVRGFDLLVPPINLQNKYESIVEALKKNRNSLVDHQDKSCGLFSSLSHKAFSGQL